jgi:DNA-binding CsgD family transcriptional regulator
VRLVERDSDLVRLGSLLSDAKEGRGRIALVRGEAGIGKTVLVRSFTDSIVGDSFVLWGVCDDLFAARPLGPIWDMATTEASLAEAVATGDRNSVFVAFLDLLTRSLRPTVAVIDDVQWADESTLDLLKFVGRRIEPTHGLLILTYRDDELHGEHPLRAVLGDLPHGVVRRIALEPMSREAVTELTGDTLQGSELWNLTRGNPLFVSELLASPDEKVPMSVRDAVGSRVLRLSPGGRDLVELSAVVPGKIELFVVDKVLGDVADAIKECESSGMLELRGEGLAFRHELVRRAVEGELSAVRRRDLNRAVLEVIEVLDFDLARRAHHALETGDPSVILWLLPDAARRAADLQSHREAVALLRELEPYVDLMNLDDRADHFDFWAQEEHLVTARDGIIERAIDLRRQLGDPGRLGQSLLMASRIAWQHSKRSLSAELAEEAAEVLASVGGEELAMAYSTISQLAMIGNDEERTIFYAERALARLGPGPSRVKLHALNNEGSVRMMNHFPNGGDQLVESFEMAGELGLPFDQVRAAINLGWSHLLHLELERSEFWLLAGLDVGQEADIPTFELHLRAERALLLAMKGEWAAAESLAHEVLAAPSIQDATEELAKASLSKIQVRRGERGAFNAAWEAWELTARADEIQRVAPAASILAEYLWLGGSLNGPVIDELISVLNGCLEVGVRPFAGSLALWLWLAGVLDEIPNDTWEPYEWLGRGDWQKAAEFFRSRAVPYEHAVALSLGDEEAKLKALSIVDSLGALPLSSLLRRELAASGVQGVPKRPNRAVPTGVEGLTARQLEVLELLGEGLTNAEIADRLFLSTRTVDHHVSAILTRLGARNRSQAAHHARRAQLLA